MKFIVSESVLWVLAIIPVLTAFGSEGFTISSPAFKDKGMIPRQYTCDGKDVSPPLSIEGVPANAKSLAIIVDDPDAPMGTWVHWVVFNIDPTVRELKEGAVPEGAKQGMNDFKKSSYGGPCPPSGAHRYFFKLYALNAVLKLTAPATKAQLEQAMKPHIVGEAQIVGLYKR
ncbi:MAG TPA: YbhB/YbcL family Raf kinase inhibitor-like protein [Syntrophorhabdaceae bacterium]|nr:YbhB/YbcL family Raf kinase inhibitor-like protein [Syntrophorhabdaceae bacterium]